MIPRSWVRRKATRGHLPEEVGIVRRRLPLNSRRKLEADELPGHRCCGALRGKGGPGKQHQHQHPEENRSMSHVYLRFHCWLTAGACGMRGAKDADGLPGRASTIQGTPAPSGINKNVEG